MKKTLLTLITMFLMSMNVLAAPPAAYHEDVVMGAVCFFWEIDGAEILGTNTTTGEVLFRGIYKLRRDPLNPNLNQSKGAPIDWLPNILEFETGSEPLWHPLWYTTPSTGSSMMKLSVINNGGRPFITGVAEWSQNMCYSYHDYKTSVIWNVRGYIDDPDGLCIIENNSIFLWNVRGTETPVIFADPPNPGGSGNGTIQGTMWVNPGWPYTHPVYGTTNLPQTIVVSKVLLPNGEWSSSLTYACTVQFPDPNP